MHPDTPDFQDIAAAIGKHRTRLPIDAAPWAPWARGVAKHGQACRDISPPVRGAIVHGVGVDLRSKPFVGDGRDGSQIPV